MGSSSYPESNEKFLSSIISVCATTKIHILTFTAKISRSAAFFRSCHSGRDRNIYRNNKLIGLKEAG